MQLLDLKCFNLQVECHFSKNVRKETLRALLHSEQIPMNDNELYYAPYVEQTDVKIHAPNQRYPFYYHDCRENVLRNLFNNITYITKEDRFDVGLLFPIREIAKLNGSTKLIDKIIEFYKKYYSPAKQGIIVDRSRVDAPPNERVRVDEDQLDEAATEWADLLACLEGVTYWWPTGRIRRPFTLGDTHEINAGIGNYLRVFAHIFGLIQPREEATEEWKCKLLTFSALEELFASCGVNIKFIPDHKVPIPEEDLYQPATLKDTRFDNHDVWVTVKLVKKHGAELSFNWMFIVGHLEVYFEGGDYDHPRYSNSRYDTTGAYFPPPPSEEIVKEQMMQALAEAPNLDSSNE